MRIAMVSEHASPLAAVGGVDSGGQNVHVDALSRALARLGHDVTVYTRRDDPGLPDRVRTAAGVVVEHLTAGPARPVPKDGLLPYVGELGAALGRRLAADPVDVVHAHFWMSGLAALAAARRPGPDSAPVVLTFHALGVTKRRHQGRHDTSPAARVRLEQGLGHDVDRVIATSTDETAELVRLGVRAEQISVVPCGVDVAEFTPDGPAAERGSRPRVLSLGRLVPRKGHDTVIRAMTAVPEAELVVAGGPATGELADDAEARRLGRLADRLGIADRVRLVGAVARPDVPALLRSADVAVCAPWYEPFGMVPLEAMACGVPVVATAVGGLVDTVQGGRTGVLVPPRCPDELASALRRLLAEPHWRKALGAAGVDRARSRYGWDRVAAETAAVYGQVLDDRAGPGPAPSATDPAATRVAR